MIRDMHGKREANVYNPEMSKSESHEGLWRIWIRKENIDFIVELWVEWLHAAFSLLQWWVRRANLKLEKQNWCLLSALHMVIYKHGKRYIYYQRKHSFIWLRLCVLFAISSRLVYKIPEKGVDRWPWYRMQGNAAKAGRGIPLSDSDHGGYAGSYPFAGGL